jgi:hypothetical protein
VQVVEMVLGQQQGEEMVLQGQILPLVVLLGKDLYQEILLPLVASWAFPLDLLHRHLASSLVLNMNVSK